MRIKPDKLEIEVTKIRQEFGEAEQKNNAKWIKKQDTAKLDSVADILEANLMDKLEEN